MVLPTEPVMPIDRGRRPGDPGPRRQRPGGPPPCRPRRPPCRPTGARAVEVRAPRRWPARRRRSRARRARPPRARTAGRRATARESIDAPSTTTSAAVEAPAHGGSQLGQRICMAAAVSQPGPPVLVHSRPWPIPERVRLVVLFGGQSAEHEVSLRLRLPRAAGRRSRTATTSTRSASPGTATGCGPTTPSAALAGAGALPPATARRGPRRPRAPPSTRCPRSCRRRGRPARRRVPARSTAPWARTAPCRACSSWPACPTSAPACSARRCAWTRRKAKDVLARHGLPQARWLGAREPRRRRGCPHARRPTSLGLPGVREAGQPRLLGRRGRRSTTHAELRGRAADRGAALRRVGRGRGGASPAARSRSPCSATTDPRASVPGEIMPSRRVLRLRGQVPRRRRRAARPGRPRPTAVAEECQRLAIAGLHRACAATAWPASTSSTRTDGRGLLLNEVNTIPGSRRSRCTRSCGRLGAAVRRARRRARAAGHRAPRTASEVLHQAMTTRTRGRGRRCVVAIAVAGGADGHAVGRRGPAAGTGDPQDPHRPARAGSARAAQPALPGAARLDPPPQPRQRSTPACCSRPATSRRSARRVADATIAARPGLA